MSELKPMTAHRAIYFMERFKKEEKLLGPNEQAAVDYVIAMLEAQDAQSSTHNPVEVGTTVQAGQVLSDEDVLRAAARTLDNEVVEVSPLSCIKDFARAIEAAVLAKQVPMTDQEIIDAAEAIKARRIEASKQAVLGRKGSKCSRCGGVIGVHSNGYHMFNRCESCDHVPMFNIDGVEYRHHGIVGEKGGV